MAKKLVKIPSVLSMTSFEVSELVQSRHDVVKKSIERLADRGVIDQPAKKDEPFKDKIGKGQTRSVYVLTNQHDIDIIINQLKHPKSPIQEGHFYIYQFKDFLKIGISKNDPHGRLKSHQHDLAKLGHSDTVIEQHVIKTAEYKRIERDVISHFAEYATIKGGEWFKGLTASAVIKFIGE